MTKIEANTLLGTIEGQSRLRPETYQIGNGDWVVIVNKFWLWDMDDWEKHKHNWRRSLYTLEAMQ